MRNAWLAPPEAGHEPSGDPERDKIVAAAAELHVRKGVLATSWPDIAELAGVPVSAVDERFAAVEDLVPACGGLAFDRLRVPPPEEAAGLFAGDEPDERPGTLVETLFGIYDRGALELDVLRRDSDRLPVLARSLDTVEEAIDALIAAALDPVTDDPEAVAVVRGLAGVPVWRALRSSGMDEAAAVRLVADAVAAALSPARR
jgi:AcrR family transcriptional regulator